MQRISIGLVIITLFVIVGPYFGIHIFGKPKSHLIPTNISGSNRNLNHYEQNFLPEDDMDLIEEDYGQIE